MSEIRHIVFDVGGVLLHYDPEIPFKRLIPDDDRRRRFLAEVCTSEWNIEQDRGRGWPEAEALLIGKFPGEAHNIRGFRRHWHEMIPHRIEGSVTILERLIAAGHDVTMLTNFAGDTFAEARERFGFLREPRAVTVSADIGLIKPDREIYEHHAEAHGLEPATTLFIDDNRKNVDGAVAAGWQAVLFTNAERLRPALAARGVAVV